MIVTSEECKLISARPESARAFEEILAYSRREVPDDM